VARGAALANASLSATCATGTGTATTNANGGYTLAIAGGALPCVLRATSGDGSTRLHSVAAAGTSASLTVNVTPLTELVVARLTGSDPSAYVTGVVASTLAATVTASNVAAAQASVASTLAAAGLPTSSAGDFISGTLVAAVPGTTGNAYDQVLDALNAQLTSAGTTLAALTTTVAAGNTAPPSGGGSASNSAVASLPADLLLKPKAANCASLASGRYRLIKQAPSPTGTVTALELFDLDASTLVFSSVSNPADTLRLRANGDCRFSAAAGAASDLDMVVSPAGVLVARAFIGSDDDSVALSARGSFRMIVGLPVQNVAVADLAGTWNTANWIADGSSFYAEGLIVTINSSGSLTQIKCGNDEDFSVPESACSTFALQTLSFSANSAGGFNLTSTDPNDPFTDRAFAYRAGNGDLMAMFLSADGSMGFLTKTRTLTLPAVGAVTASWNVASRPSGLASDLLSYNTHTVASVNATAGTLVRNSANDGSSVTVPQTLQYNQSRNGYIHRPAATTTASNGSAATVREAYLLPLRGFGLTPYYLPATSGTGASSNASFGVSVGRQP